MMEDKLISIINEVQAMQGQSQLAKEPSSLHAKIQQLKPDNQQMTDSQLRSFLKLQQADPQNEKRVL